MAKSQTLTEYKQIKKQLRAAAPIRFIKNLLNIALIGEILVMLAFVVLLVVPTFVHIYPYSIITASMTPKIPVGSLVYVDQSLDNSLYQVNDVIAFKETGTNYPIVHRVQSVEDGYYVTKGDANTNTENVTFKEVLGKEVYYIPQLGNIASQAMQYKFLFVAIALGTAALLFVFGAIQKHQESKKRREYLEAQEAKDSQVTTPTEVVEIDESVNTDEIPAIALDKKEV